MYVLYIYFNFVLLYACMQVSRYVCMYIILSAFINT